MVAPQTETVELNADLVERAQREADNRGIALKQFVDDALTRWLAINPSRQVMDRPETIRDRQGREVLLSPERWQHIIGGHPEIESCAQEIHRAVESPTAVLRGREPDEEWLYLEGAGPSRWLKVVVIFDSDGSGRIITAFARRRKP